MSTPLPTYEENQNQLSSELSSSRSGSGDTDSQTERETRYLVDSEGTARVERSYFNRPKTPSAVGAGSNVNVGPVSASVVGGEVTPFVDGLAKRVVFEYQPSQGPIQRILGVRRSTLSATISTIPTHFPSLSLISLDRLRLQIPLIGTKYVNPNINPTNQVQSSGGSVYSNTNTNANVVGIQPEVQWVELTEESYLTFAGEDLEVLKVVVALPGAGMAVIEDGSKKGWSSWFTRPTQPASKPQPKTGGNPQAEELKTPSVSSASDRAGGDVSLTDYPQDREGGGSPGGIFEGSEREVDFGSINTPTKIRAKKSYKNRSTFTAINLALTQFFLVFFFVASITAQPILLIISGSHLGFFGLVAGIGYLVAMKRVYEKGDEEYVKEYKTKIFHLKLLGQTCIFSAIIYQIVFLVMCGLRLAPFIVCSLIFMGTSGLAACFAYHAAHVIERKVALGWIVDEEVGGGAIAI